MSSPRKLLRVLGDLFDAELNSVFRFLADSTPYIPPKAAGIRPLVAELSAASVRRAGELQTLIERLGGVATERGLQREEQYVAYLSITYLLPKLIDAKRRMIERYEAARAEAGDAFPEVSGLLQRHIAEQQRHLERLIAAGHSL